jgi:alpha-L-fucosidase
LAELLTNYGRVDEVWFDGANGEGPNGKKQVYDFDTWYKLIRLLQPEAVIAVMGPDVRWVGTESGQGRLTEWSVMPVDEGWKEKIDAGSQKDPVFAPKGDMMKDDLGSRDKLANAKGLIWYPAETDVSIRPGWFNHPAEDGSVKTPGELMDLYFSSVGRNSVLLLNVPPDKRGLISDSDVKSLSEWRKKYDRTFSVDLAKGAAVKRYSGKGGGWVVELMLARPVSFDVLSLQEDIRVGQRVEKFKAEYFNGHGWKPFAEGTTIGYKRLLHFDAVTASKVRLTIESSRLDPVISEIGLFKMAE